MLYGLFVSKKRKIKTKVKRESFYNQALPSDNIQLDYLDILKDSTILLPTKDEVKRISKKKD